MIILFNCPRTGSKSSVRLFINPESRYEYLYSKYHLKFNIVNFSDKYVNPTKCKSDPALKALSPHFSESDPVLESAKPMLTASKVTKQTFMGPEFSPAECGDLHTYKRRDKGESYGFFNAQ